MTALDQAITAQDESGGNSEHLTGLIETDAPIPPGDSGGSLISTDAKIIGIITAGSTSGSEGPVVGAAASDQTATQGYAIPINQAKAIADDIIAGKSSDTIHIGGTPFLGVQVDGDATAGATGGIVVAGTVEFAAAKAGLAAGDVVTSIDGRTVEGVHH